MTKLIAELCQNHNGRPDIFARQIEEAAKAGADIIKMQSIWSQDLTRRDRFEEGSSLPDGTITAIRRPYQTEYERLSKLDLKIEDHLFFIEKCKEQGVIPMTTIFARHRIPEIGVLPWPGKMIKVASYDCASHPFLRELAVYFDEFIISTGASYDHEIQKTVNLMREIKKDFAFLHCVTSYPNTLEMANLSRMEWLRQFGPSGWSDHTKVEQDGIKAAKVAILLGADYVERHFTILPAADSKDGPVSITPSLLRELSDFRRRDREEQQEIVNREIPEWKILLGTAQRAMTPAELLNRDYYRGRFAAPHPSGEGWLYNWEDLENHAV